MTINSFFKLVEIQTKVASLFPFLIGIAYAKYRYDSLDGMNILWMLVSLVCIDMATTAINNFMDYKRALKKTGYGFETHNAIVQFQLKEKHVQLAIFLLLLIATGSGILLVIHTDWLVLFIGMVSFGVGILYSYGPLPISRTPLGELFSGFFMGFFILFLAVYINIYEEGLIIFMINNWVFTLDIQLKEILFIFLAALPLVMVISNIMLANNICDLSEDIENKRYTLPFYIGKQRALWVFRISYYIAFIDWIALILLKVMPMTTILAVLTIIPIERMIRVFVKQQSKKDTFVLSVKIMVLMSGTYLLSLLAGIFIHYFLQ